METKVAQGSVVEDQYEENPELANNISKAVLEVRKALDTVEILEAAQNSKKALTEDLVRLESKLLQSVVYIPSSDNDFDPIQKKEKEARDVKKPGVLKTGMTRSQKKRAKTAAKKAAEVAEANMKIAAEKAKEALHAKLAADALATLAMLPKNSGTPEQNESPKSSDELKFPLTDYEMQRFAVLSKIGVQYPSNSEEGKIMAKYHRHENEIKRILTEKLKIETESKLFVEWWYYVSILQGITDSCKKPLSSPAEQVPGHVAVQRKKKFGVPLWILLWRSRSFGKP